MADRRCSMHNTQSEPTSAAIVHAVLQRRILALPAAHCVLSIVFNMADAVRTSCTSSRRTSRFLDWRSHRWQAQETDDLPWSPMVVVVCPSSGRGR